MAQDGPRLPLGMQMMMKSFGLDPDDVKKQVTEFSGLIRGIFEALQTVHASNLQIAENQRLIMQRLGIEHENADNRPAELGNNTGH